MVRRVAALVIGLLLPMAAHAQSWAEAPRADHVQRFEHCLPEQMEAFETRLRGDPGYGQDWRRDLFNVHWVQHCGYLAMGICEVSSNSLICQRRLRAAFDDRAAAMRAVLPPPEEVEGLALSPLYGQVWAVAHGANAGDDCAGETYRRTLWCRSFQAVLKFEEAVWAWQVARLAGVMGPLDWDEMSGLER